MSAIDRTAQAHGRRLRNTFVAFLAADRGNVALTFGLLLLPIITGVGAAIDYSRANAAKSSIQSALDAAVLAGGIDGSSNWKSVATNVYFSNLKSDIAAATPTFTVSEGSTYGGSANASIASSIMGLIGIKRLDISANATAMKAEGDNSCILTLDNGQPTSHISLTLNGAPVINLSGCTIRSNTSLDCNGHDGNVTKSYASGSATACGRPTSNAPLVPDIYKDLAKNISTLCAGARPGITWTPGTLPMGAGIKTTNAAGSTEYHICGDLTVSGSGALTGASPGSDVIIVVENGNLIIDDKSVISTLRTTFILTGNNNWPAKVVFPQGNGKAATLSLSPSTSAGNPWQGVALYLDPKLTKDVDNKWGPGADFDADGLVYLGNSNVITDGNTSSANS